MHRTLRRAPYFLVLSIAILLSSVTLSLVTASSGNSGALLTLTDQTIHVVWQFEMEYDSSEMVDEIDSLHEALRFNYDRSVETQLESLITDALRKTNENLICRNSKILLDTNIDTWAKILLEFDVEGAITVEEDYLIVDISWRELTVKGKINLVHDRVEHGFYPRKSMGLKWPFGSELSSWSVDHHVQQSKVVSTSFTNVYERGVEIIADVTIKPVNMTITVPGSATAERDYIRVPRESTGTTSTRGTSPQMSLYTGLGIVSIVGVAVIFGVLYLWRHREGIPETLRITRQVGEKVNLEPLEVCPVCEGKGELFCTRCHGTGRDNSNECPICNGRGRRRCPICNTPKELGDTTQNGQN